MGVGAVRIVTAQESQRLDKITIDRIGIPSIVLMENAGRSVAEEVLRQLKKFSKKYVSIVCGLGNNAGDGFVCARHLINHNVPTKILIIGNPAHLKDDAAIHYRILRNLRIPIYLIRSYPEFAKSRSFPPPFLLSQESKEVVGNPDEAMIRPPIETFGGDNFWISSKKSKILVDAIFGVGLNRDIEEPFKSVIEKINRSKARVISVDVPSGLDATTGKIHGVCVRAKTTVTFSFPKKGFFIRQGPEYVGKIIVADIGIPSAKCHCERFLRSNLFY